MSHHQRLGFIFIELAINPRPNKPRTAISKTQEKQFSRNSQNKLFGSLLKIIFLLEYESARSENSDLFR
jgi:hypothetical protein